MVKVKAIANTVSVCIILDSRMATGFVSGDC